VDPEDRTVQVCSFEKGTPMSAYGEKDEIPVGVLPGCTVKLSEVFDADNRYQISDNR
jgi:hypothetical protein